MWSNLTTAGDLHPLKPLGPDSLTWCGGMVGSPQRGRAGIGGQLRCHGFALPSDPMLFLGRLPATP